MFCFRWPQTIVILLPHTVYSIALNFCLHFTISSLKKTKKTNRISSFVFFFFFTLLVKMKPYVHPYRTLFLWFMWAARGCTLRWHTCYHHVSSWADDFEAHWLVYVVLFYETQNILRLRGSGHVNWRWRTQTACRQQVWPTSTFDSGHVKTSTHTTTKNGFEKKKL